MTTSNWFKVQTISQTQRGKLSCPFHSHSYMFRIKSKFFNFASVTVPRFCCACRPLLKSLKCLPLLSPHCPGFARIGCTKRLFKTLRTLILDLWLFRLTKVIFFFHRWISTPARIPRSAVGFCLETSGLSALFDKRDFYSASLVASHRFEILWRWLTKQG